MVRLFVPEGEAQHDIVRHHPDPIVANSQVLVVPRQSALLATGITAVLAIVGKSRPGTLLKTTAYLSAANLSITACQLYGQRDVNRALFKLDNIEPRPGKLWERTKHWTVEDVIIGGGVLGLSLALNPRALPGVGGWKRFLGVATVGCALGSFVGETRLVPFPPHLVRMMYMADAQTRFLHYDRLKQDPQAQEYLSRFGKIALAFYTWPGFGININPFDIGSTSGARGALGAPQVPFGEDPHARISQQVMDEHTLIQIEFNKGELKGPDIEHGYRAYKDSLTDRDESALQDWLQHLQEVREMTATEAQYVWQYLAAREQDFYDIVEDDREKDIVRREIQLLNNMASDFASRDAILAYHIADALKRLRQIEQKDIGGQNLLLTSQAMQAELPPDWKDHYSPQLVAEQVRINWSRQKQLLGFLEHSNSMHGDSQPGVGTTQEAHLKQIRQNAEDMKKNVEATERLLKEFEEQIRRADEHVKN